MVFKKGRPTNTPGKGQFKKGNDKAKGNGRPRKDDIKAAVRKITPEIIDQLRKIITGSAPSPTQKIQAAELLLSYGYGKPPQSQAVQMSGPGGEPLKASPSVFIYNSIEEAQAAAVAGATTGDELPPMVFLPSNGFEVRLKPDGTPEEAPDKEDL